MGIVGSAPVAERFTATAVESMARDAFAAFFELWKTEVVALPDYQRNPNFQPFQGSSSQFIGTVLITDAPGSGNAMYLTLHQDGELWVVFPERIASRNALGSASWEPEGAQHVFIFVKGEEPQTFRRNGLGERADDPGSFAEDLKILSRALSSSFKYLLISMGEYPISKRVE